MNIYNFKLHTTVFLSTHLVYISGYGEIAAPADPAPADPPPHSLH